MARINLTAAEQKIYDNWLEVKNKPSVSPSRAVKLFELFLHGISCEEIVKINAPEFCLEQVLEARVRDGWDEKRDAYTTQLYAGAVENVRQIQVESVHFVADMLAAAHKQHGDKIRRYLQTGDEKDLAGAMSIGSFQTYKQVAETLLKLTGQDRSSIEKRLDKPVPSVVAPMNIDKATILQMSSAQGVVTPEMAGRILNLLDSKRPREENEDDDE